MNHDENVTEDHSTSSTIQILPSSSAGYDDSYNDDEHKSMTSSQTQGVTPLPDQQQQQKQQSKQKQSQQQGHFEKWQFFLFWYGLAALSHISNGGHNSFSSYLKAEESQKPPEFSLAGFGNLLVLLCYSPRIIYKLVQTIRRRRREEVLSLEQQIELDERVASLSPSSRTVDRVIRDEEDDYNEEEDNDNDDDNDVEANVGRKGKKVVTIVSSGEENAEAEDEEMEDQELHREQPGNDLVISTTTTTMAGRTSGPERQLEKPQQQLLKRQYSLHILWNRGKSFLMHPAFYILLVSVVVRSLVRAPALDYTTAVFFQLVELQAPIVIAFVSVYVFKRGTLHKATIFVLVATLAGSLALIMGETTNHEPGFHWSPNFKNITSNFGLGHLIGISLAFVSAITLASKTLAIDYITVNEHMRLSCENMFIAEKLALAVVFMTLSLIFGDYSQFGTMGWKRWSVFLFTTFFNEFLGSFLSIYATAKLGSTTYGIMLPIRLLSTIFIAMIMLGEAINNFLEIVGIVVVAASLIVYMTWKRFEAKKQKNGNNNSQSQDDASSMAPSLKTSSRFRMEPFSNLRADT